MIALVPVVKWHVLRGRFFCGQVPTEQLILGALKPPLAGMIAQHSSEFDAEEFVWDINRVAKMGQQPIDYETMRNAAIYDYSTDHQLFDIVQIH